MFGSRSIQKTCLLLAASCLWLSCDALADSYRKLFADAEPSVVTVYTVSRNAAPESPTGSVSQSGIGSGFLVDDEGYVMTAAHVIQTADLVQVEFADGWSSTAAIIYSDPAKDVALLKLDKLPENPRPARLGDSDRVQTGDEVFVIGAPLGLSYTLTVGHISGRRGYDDAMMRGIQAETFQTDAAINQGNSGGPLFNKRGEVIGIVSHIRSRSGGSDGLGFAVTINDAVDTLMAENSQWTGMTGILLTGDLAKALNVPQPYSFLVQRTALNSPSSKIGLRSSNVPVTIAGQDLLIGGDIILAVNGIEISPEFDAQFRQQRDAMEPGDEIALKVLRSGKTITLSSSLR
ncbi:MAG: trypsin-like peptidase domain-containing protein [Woeseiaceae bacterium]|nr:trypsin-like peptidase domain-containing protein [Woeseiaceae bacterium]